MSSTRTRLLWDGPPRRAADGRADGDGCRGEHDCDLNCDLPGGLRRREGRTRTLGGGGHRRRPHRNGAADLGLSQAESGTPGDDSIPGEHRGDPGGCAAIATVRSGSRFREQIADASGFRGRRGDLRLLGAMMEVSVRDSGRWAVIFRGVVGGLRGR